MKLDVCDKKILYYLELNSRMPLSKLSKLVRISREMLTYRIERLEKNGIIKSYLARINQSFFCLGGGNLVLKLVHVEKERYDIILNYLKSHGNINWFADLCGTYDFSITFLYKDNQELAKIVNDIIIFLGSDLLSHNLSLYISEYKFFRRNILELDIKDENNLIETHFKKSSLSKLDETDLIILRELSINSRIKNIELADKIKMGEDIVRIRIRKLEQRNLILGYTIVINPYAMDFEGYSLYLQVENMTGEMQNKIKSYIYSSPYIYFCGRIAGKFNLIIGIYAKNRKHYKDILLELRDFFGRSLKDYEFQLLMDEHKEVFIPGNLFIRE